MELERFQEHISCRNRQHQAYQKLVLVVCTHSHQGSVIWWILHVHESFELVCRSDKALSMPLRVQFQSSNYHILDEFQMENRAHLSFLRHAERFSLGMGQHVRVSASRQKLYSDFRSLLPRKCIWDLSCTRLSYVIWRYFFIVFMREMLCGLES